MPARRSRWVAGAGSHICNASCAARLVEFTRSQNSTVRWRRSPVSLLPRGSAGAPRGPAARIRPAASIAAPHCEQNIASGAFSEPHFGRRLLSGVPHRLQNREPAHSRFRNSGSAFAPTSRPRDWPPCIIKRRQRASRRRTAPRCQSNESLLTSVTILLSERKEASSLRWPFRGNFPSSLVSGKIGQVLSDADVFEHANRCVRLYLAEISGFARLTPTRKQLES
jgi:hypothetical protein